MAQKAHLGSKDSLWLNENHLRFNESRRGSLEKNEILELFCDQMVHWRSKGLIVSKKAHKVSLGLKRSH